MASIMSPNQAEKRIETNFGWGWTWLYTGNNTLIVKAE